MDLFEQPESEERVSNAPAYTVTEISNALKKTVEENFEHVHVRGEVGRVTRAPSGHVYLDLKDDKSVINCNIWRPIAQRLDFEPEQGMEVIATGKLSTYAPRSGYNLIINQIQIAGAGAMMAILEKRKKALAAEGLFDENRKKPIPYIPQKIGVISSPTGAVIKDIIHRIRDRFPSQILLWPVAVQGNTSAQEVTEAIEGFNALPKESPLRPDVIIIARGGGSIEDLWSFNEENVVRAVAQSEIPIISAVGHETDTTLIDYAADMRAPTPTAAAEFVVPVRAELMAYLQDIDARRIRAMQKLRENAERRLRDLARALPKPSDLLAIPNQKLDLLNAKLDGNFARQISQKQTRYNQISARLNPLILSGLIEAKSQSLKHSASQLRPAITRKLQNAQNALNTQTRLLNALSYTKVLERGFAVILDDNGKLLKSAEETRKSSQIIIRQKDGENKAEIKG